MQETNQVKTEWNRKYYVNNDEILALINLWKEAPTKKKPALQGRIIERMGYIIHKRISFYKNSDMYEDLMQEARIGIITAMERFDQTRSVNFFHFSIWHVQNKIRIYLKKQRRRRPEILVEHPYECVDIGIDPTIILEEEEAKKILLSAVEELPEIDRNVLKMRFGLDDGQNEGQTYQQIGDVFSVSKQRIEQINSRAVSKLRKNIKLKDFFNDVG
jgi:RNA polymerase sigma factor (sigma-70 family)